MCSNGDPVIKQRCYWPLKIIMSCNNCTYSFLNYMAYVCIYFQNTQNTEELIFISWLYCDRHRNYCRNHELWIVLPDFLWLLMNYDIYYDRAHTKVLTSKLYQRELYIEIGTKHPFLLYIHYEIKTIYTTDETAALIEFI